MIELLASRRTARYLSTSHLPLGSSSQPSNWRTSRNPEALDLNFLHEASAADLAPEDSSHPATPLLQLPRPKRIRQWHRAFYHSGMYPPPHFKLFFILHVDPRPFPEDVLFRTRPIAANCAPFPCIALRALSGDKRPRPCASDVAMQRSQPDLFSLAITKTRLADNISFCSAHCEKQIVVPNTSILFCSEKCKRKDQAKAPQGMPCYNPYSTTPPHDYLDSLPIKNYVQPSSPTPPRSFSSEYDEMPMSRAMASLTLNTTFYAPELSRSSSGSGSTSSGDTSPTSSSSSSNIYQPPRRPPHLRSMTAGSISTLSNIAAPAPSPQYHYAQGRPLPPLHRPHPFSTSPRSIDLVTPYMSSRSSPQEDYYPHTPTKEEQVRYEKRYTSPTTRGGCGNLKTLFDFDAIRGEPYSAEAMARSPDSYFSYNNTPILARMSPTAVRMRS